MLEEEKLFSEQTVSRLKKLQFKNNWTNLFSLYIDWGVIFGVAYLTQRMSYFPLISILSLIIIAGRMRALDNLLHESSHGLLFRSKFLNRWITFFFICIPMVSNLKSYTKSHYLHHKHLWTDKDPDTTELINKGFKTENMKISFVIKNFFLANKYFSTIPIDVFKFLKAIITTKDFSPIEYFIKLSFWTVIFVAVHMYGLWLEFAIFWIVPFILILPLIRLCSDIADHFGLQVFDRGKARALNGSRNSYGNIVERLILFPHHDTYHIVHHLYPFIPHYNLKKAHIILMSEKSYREAHLCTGFFKTFYPGKHSVLDDIISKQTIEMR